MPSMLIEELTWRPFEPLPPPQKKKIVGLHGPPWGPFQFSTILGTEPEALRLLPNVQTDTAHSFSEIQKSHCEVGFRCRKSGCGPPLGGRHVPVFPEAWQLLEGVWPGHSPGLPREQPNARNTVFRGMHCCTAHGTQSSHALGHTHPIEYFPESCAITTHGAVRKVGGIMFFVVRRKCHDQNRQVLH